MFDKREHPKGGIFPRVDVKNQEVLQLPVLNVPRLVKDSALAGGSDAGASGTYGGGHLLLG